MFSAPPQRTTRASWHRIARSACMAASNPEPHTLLMVMAVTWSGQPAPKAICRAGFCPKPACRTQPIKASSTTEGSIPSKADWATLAPRSVAVVLENPPRKRPIGERTAERITVSDRAPFYIRRDP